MSKVTKMDIILVIFNVFDESCMRREKIIFINLIHSAFHKCIDFIYSDLSALSNFITHMINRKKLD